MKIHILGICGTFMGGIALLARELGFTVSGSDVNVYPPMSTQLEQQGITLLNGYDPAHLLPRPDVVIVGNAMTRGNPVVEYMLDQNIPYISGPQWLAEQALRDRWVLAVAGTHGKTTTTSMLTWILQAAGLNPGFLVGGVPQNFGISAQLGQGKHFVIEADEYDTAFFDKRSKFVHYRPRTLVINNLEFDHADIFPDLAAIQRQFHHLVRTVPASGCIIRPTPEAVIDATLALGCWTPQVAFGDSETAGWWAQPISPDYSAFEVWDGATQKGTVHWSVVGRHNAHNALAAIAAARHAGVEPAMAIEGLSRFENTKRRLEKIAEIDGITVYDDFAHHPTAITVTIEALRQRVGPARIIAVAEPRSNTMRMGVFQESLGPAFDDADRVLLFQPSDLGWDLSQAMQCLGDKVSLYTTVDDIVTALADLCQPSDHILIMSNGGFGGIHKKLVYALHQRI